MFVVHITVQRLIVAEMNMKRPEAVAARGLQQQPLVRELDDKM